jgi:hypothetical protein
MAEIGDNTKIFNKWNSVSPAVHCRLHKSYRILSSAQQTSRRQTPISPWSISKQLTPWNKALDKLVFAQLAMIFPAFTGLQSALTRSQEIATGTYP